MTVDEILLLEDAPLLLQNDAAVSTLQDCLSRGVEFWTPMGKRLTTVEDIARAFDVCGRILGANPRPYSARLETIR